MYAVGCSCSCLHQCDMAVCSFSTHQIMHCQPSSCWQLTNANTTFSLKRYPTVVYLLVIIWICFSLFFLVWNNLPCFCNCWVTWPKTHKIIYMFACKIPVIIMIIIITITSAKQPCLRFFSSCQSSATIWGPTTWFTLAANKTFESTTMTYRAIILIIIRNCVRHAGWIWGTSSHYVGEDGTWDKSSVTCKR